MAPRRFHHGATDSTSERAFAALAAGDAQHLDLHVATTQSAGRGRRGSAWHSADGGGLYASFVLVLPRAASPSALSVAAGLAVWDCARRLGLDHARLKWPNDLMVGDAKLAGVLIESRALDPERPRYVLGVGLNVGQRAFPAALARERAVTSLALEGLAVGVPEAERLLADRVEERIGAVVEDQLDRLAQDYLDAADLTGRLRATLGAEGGETVEGDCQGLCLRTGLRLATPGGTRVLALEHLRALRRV